MPTITIRSIPLDKAKALIKAYLACNNNARIYAWPANGCDWEDDDENTGSWRGHAEIVGSRGGWLIAKDPDAGATLPSGREVPLDAKCRIKPFSGDAVQLELIEP